MKTPWIFGFTVMWSSVCGCSEKCYYYALFGKENGKTRVLKRIFGINKHEYHKLVLALAKYFLFEHRKRNDIHKS
jgi:hypothetical protein